MKNHRQQNQTGEKKGQSKSVHKNSFASNSGPYHGASLLLNKLLVQSAKKKKSKTNLSSEIGSVGGLKSLVFVTKKDNSTEMICSKSTYATLCQTLESKPLIDKLLDQYPPSSKKGQKKKVPLRVLLMNKCKNTGLLYILLHELLFSKFQKIKGGGGLKRVISSYEPDFRQLQKSLHLTYDEVKIEKEKDQKQKLGGRYNFPRYARVNTIKTTLGEVISKLTHIESNHDQGDDEIINQKAKEGAHVTKVEKPLLDSNTKIYLDPHINHLLVLPPQIMRSDSAKFYSHSLIQEGELILQDKASCFPALALVHSTTRISHDSPRNTFQDILKGDILDACAAPGNKTSHLAALLTEEYRKKNQHLIEVKSNESKHKNKKPWPKVIALDKDPRRFQILKSRMSQLGSPSSYNTESNSKYVEVHPLQKDFLQTSPTDPLFKNLKSILLDPSCSGSGIVTSPDRNETFKYKENEGEEHQRIEALSKFQITCLRHAMSFPQVERIVYSTCSIHELENEGVVAAALGLETKPDNPSVVDHNSDQEPECKANLRDINKTDKHEESWELIAPSSLTGWKRRGNPVKGLTQAQAQCLIRCDAKEGDETNGFFVSCFQRKKRNKMNDTDESIRPKSTFVELMYNDESVSLPFYSGEHKTLLNNGEVNPEAPQDEVDEDEKLLSIQSKSSVVQTKFDGKINKKREKALLWKRKQREQKESRLKNKKRKELDSKSN